MKKILRIIGSFSLAVTGISNVIACNKTKENGGENNPKPYTKISIIPNIFDLKKELIKEGYNIDNLDIEMNPRMKSANIRSMPDVDNTSFLVKKINFEWKTNNIEKIITKTSLPYVNTFENKENVDKSLVLNAINILNGTKFTFDDLDIQMDENHNFTLTPKKNGKFVGNSVMIVNEPFSSFSDIFPNQKLGYIYFDEEMYNSLSLTNSGRFAQFMEFLGDRNQLAKYYKYILERTLKNPMIGIKIPLLQFPNFNEQMIISIEFAIPNIVNNSNLAATFIAKSSNKNRYFLNFNKEKPTKNKEIDISLNKTYTKDTVDMLRYDIVKEILGQQFADKYKDILYNEIQLIKFDENNKTAILTPKPGSKIFAVSDLLAQEYTEIPYYTLKIIFK